MPETVWPNGPPLVTESVDENGTEWGLSFNGPNPAYEDYVPMKDRDSAFKLRDILLSHTDPNRAGRVGADVSQEEDRHAASG